MSRIEQIIKRARDTLADSSGERWSDERLLRLVSEAQQDIAKHTLLLKEQTTINLVPNVRTYTLPDNLWLITRAESNNCVLDLVTHEEMDRLASTQSTKNYSRSEYRHDIDSSINTCWETDTASAIEALIYDKRNLHEINVYPIPDDSISVNDYTFDSLDEVEFSGAELYGVTTGISDYSLTSDYGVVVDLFDPLFQNDVFNSEYGVITKITEATGVVNLWYVVVPAAIESVYDELEIPSMWDTAVKHYVVGHAFDDDYDTRFAEKSAKALSMYDRELNVTKKFESQNNVKASNRQTHYRGAFD